MSSNTVVDLLRHGAKSEPVREFAHCDNEVVTYGAIDATSDRLAAGLAAAGVQPGDRVAIIALNRPELLELYFACPKAGAVQVPLNAFLKGDFLRHQLVDCEPSTLVVDAEAFEACSGMLGSLQSLQRLVVLEPVPATIKGLDIVPYADLRDCGDALPARRHGVDDLMSIIYTSGTTGLPKGCELPAGYYTRVAARMVDFMGLEPSDRIITPAPLFHAGARTMGVAAALAANASIVIEPEFRSSRFLDRIVETKSTVLLGVGAIAKALMARPPSAEDRSHALRLAVCVPADRDLRAAFERRFGVQVCTQLYGQTECTPVTYRPAAAGSNDESAGYASPDVEIRIVSEDDRDVAVGEVGELVLRPLHRHAMFRGYWQKPSETLSSFRGLWYHTGDLCRLDDDGLLYFVDRRVDRLRRRGENVSSIQLECTIGSHPKVSEVAVHAVPSNLTEDDIKACIVLTNGTSVTAAEMFEFFKNSLPYFAIPRYIEVLDALPKNAMERVQKAVLRERAVTKDTWDFEALGFAVERESRR